MLKKMKTIRVDLGARSYSIHLKARGLADLARLVQREFPESKIAVITDRNVARRYSRSLMQVFSGRKKRTVFIKLPSGEKTKTLTTCQKIYTQLLRRRFDRGDLVIAFGGGVVGDIAGFVAATYARGLPFVQVPTTLVAQCDAAIGGKVGVNHPLGKNMIGAFHQPRFVFVDPAFLNTLPGRELRQGLAEVVKYALIRDRKLFRQLETKLPRWAVGRLDGFEPVLVRCCQIKAEIVARDERDYGLRHLLNFGHSIGHALEAAADYGRFLHGEAVVLGILAANWIAVGKKTLSPDESNRAGKLLALLARRMPRVRFPIEKALSAVAVDKKHRQGTLRFVLLRRIGQAVIREDVTTAETKKALVFLRDWLQTTGRAKGAG